MKIEKNSFPENFYKLDQKIFLVTGSTEGIGYTVAEALLQHGGRVTITGLSDSSSVSHLLNEYGSNNINIQLGDLKDPLFCKDLIDQTVAIFGTIHGIVNNAADLSRDSIETFSCEVFNTSVAVNLRAPLLLASAALPIFKSNMEGVIVNIGSTNAECGENNLLSYAITKGGMCTATKTLANSLAQYKVRVNQLNVGWVDTPNEIQRMIDEGHPENWTEKIAP
jgi:NAD(P)-dependent dehydrogenase (short-subunit alcohol dehydrogenase family)